MLKTMGHQATEEMLQKMIKVVVFGEMVVFGGDGDGVWWRLCMVFSDWWRWCLVEMVMIFVYTGALYFTPPRDPSIPYPIQSNPIHL